MSSRCSLVKKSKWMKLKENGIRHSFSHNVMDDKSDLFVLNLGLSVLHVCNFWPTFTRTNRKN